MIITDLFIIYFDRHGIVTLEQKGQVLMILVEIKNLPYVWRWRDDVWVLKENLLLSLD